MLNSRIVRSQATTMKIRNKNGRIHTAFSAFDTLPGFRVSATLSLPVWRTINPLDKYCPDLLRRQMARHVVPANAGTHTLCRFVLALESTPSARSTPGVMAPGVRRDDGFLN